MSGGSFTLVFGTDQVNGVSGPAVSPELAGYLQSSLVGPMTASLEVPANSMMWIQTLTDTVMTVADATNRRAASSNARSPAISRSISRT
jgi:hypothetical protein